MSGTGSRWEASATRRGKCEQWLQRVSLGGVAVEFEGHAECVQLRRDSDVAFMHYALYSDLLLVQ